MKRRMIFVSLAILLVISMIAVTGCQTKDTTTGTTKTTTATSGSSATTTSGETGNLTKPGEFPIVKEQETITIVRLAVGETYDHETNLFTETYTERTNVKTVMIFLPGEQFKERLNLMFSGGDQFDMVVTANNSQTIYSKTEQMQLFNQGAILPLEDLIDTQSVWLKQAFDEVEGWREFMTGPDGHIYGFPYYNECYHCTWYHKMFMNKEWLTNLNLSVPTTTEEFYTVLKAFKEQDANDNGDPNDEIPLASCNILYSRMDGFLMCSFLYSDSEDRLYVDQGMVKAAFVQPEYKEGLKYLNKLYSEGLIYIESFAQDIGALIQLNSQKYESIVGAVPGAHHAWVGNREQGETPRWFEYVAIAPLKGPNGVQTTRYDYYNNFGLASGVGGFIPRTCKNPELVMRFIDWMYSEEGSMAIELGFEGVNWVKASPGEVGTNGEPAIWKGIRLQEGDQYYGNSTWGAVFPNYMPSRIRNGPVAPETWYSLDENGNPLGLEKYLYEQTRDNYVPYSEPLENILPPLYYPLEDLDELGQLKATIYPFIEESVARFTTGDLDLETDWDNYLSELDKLDLDRYLELTQKAYDQSSFKP